MLADRWAASLEAAFSAHFSSFLDGKVRQQSRHKSLGTWLAKPSRATPLPKGRSE
jgi:hypothetical protein